MSKVAARERRLDPRIDHSLPLNVSANGYDFSTTTQNISCNGAYCCITKYIPPFTKVHIKMDLPLVAEHKLHDSTIECKGVVVRSVDESTGGFNIAIYFNGINDAQRKKISHYINQFLPR